MKLSMVIPAHNEEENIASLIDKVEKELGDCQLVVVADHCTDSTLEIAKKKSQEFSNLVVVENKMPAGFANALRTGFLNAGGDFILPLMGDLCDDLLTVKQMLRKADEGYDVICGSRYMKGGSRLGGSRLKGFLSSAGGRSLSFLLGIPTHDIANAFKMYHKKVIQSIEIKSKGFEISMEIPLKAYYLGFKITEVATTWRERTKGKSTFKIFKLLPDYLKLYFWAVWQILMGRKKTQ